MKYKATKHLTKLNIFAIIKSGSKPLSDLVAKAKKSAKGYTELNRFFETQFRHKRRKGTIMKNKVSRFAAATLVLVAGVLLAACGGGGDAGSFASVPTPTAPVASVPSWDNAPVAVAQAPVQAQSIARDARTLSAAPQDPWGGVAPLTATNQLFDRVAETTYSTYFPSHQATQTYEQYWYRFYPETGCYVGVDMNTAGIYVMACGFGNSPVYVGQLLQYYTPTAPMYTDIVLANSDNGLWYPWKIVITGGTVSGTVTATAEKAINATRFQTGVYPLAGCIFNTVKLSTGSVKLNCQEAVSGSRYNLVWNPVTNRITEYDNSEGAYPAISDATWVDNQPDQGNMDGYADISTGKVYSHNQKGSEIHFIRSSDGADVILPISIGSIKAFGAFSH